MAAERAVLIAIIILALAVSPLAVPLLGGSSPGDATAYAQLVRQISNPGGDDDGNGNNDDGIANNEDDDGDDDGDDNGDDGGDDDNDNNNDGGGDDDGGNDNDGDDGGDDDGGDDDGGNDNDGGDDNGDDDNGDDDNDNDGDDDDDDDDDDNDNGGGVVRRVVVRDPKESVNRPTKCFDTREVGVVQLGTGSYDVTVTVMPHSSLNQTTRLTLRSLSPSSVPAPTGGTLVDSVVFQLDAQAGCDGVAIGTLPNLVNMGIIYNVPNVLDKSKLQIVRLEGGSWVNVDTVPDPVPGNPYVSTTTGVAGTYALIVKP